MKVLAHYVLMVTGKACSTPDSAELLKVNLQHNQALVCITHGAMDAGVLQNVLTGQVTMLLHSTDDIA
jgi:hypothetical protein